MAEEEKILHLYNWADYVPEVLIEGFEEEYGIRVYYNVYENDLMLDAKLLAGNTGYDLVGLAGVDLQRFIPIDQFQPLDKNKLSNLRHLEPNLMKRLAISDPENRYAVPYFWGSTGVSYNVDMVRERMPDAPLHSAAMLLEPEIISRFEDCGVSFLDDSGTVVRMTLKYLGYDIDRRDEEAFAAVERQLRSVRPYIRYFDSNRLAIDLPSGEVCLAMAWNGDYGAAKKIAADENLDVDLAYSVPAEGTNLWMDTWSLLADAPHPDNAHLFLNYLMRPEVMAAVSNEERYPNANLSSWSMLIPEVSENPEITHTEEMMERIYQRVAYDVKDLRRVNRIWARFKAGFE